MKTYYCHSCNKTTGYKRNLGWGTFFGGIFTLGISLLFIPFYPKRCIICGGDVKERVSNIILPEVDIRRINVKNSLSGLQSEQIITCPYCNRNIRSDSIECPLCGMIVPSDIRRKINSAPAMDTNN